MQSQPIIIHTDGACKGNPGIGGYGAILQYNGTLKEICGACPDTTNNRMELTAVIEALKQLKRHCQVQVFTDSKYVQQGITVWIKGWIQKNWKNVKNIDLWQELNHEAAKHSISWHWVKGHSGDKWNDRADELANLAINNMQSTKDKDAMLR